MCEPQLERRGATADRTIGFPAPDFSLPPVLARPMTDWIEAFRSASRMSLFTEQCRMNRQNAPDLECAPRDFEPETCGLRVRRYAQAHHGWRAAEGSLVPLVGAGRGWIAGDRLLGI